MERPVGVLLLACTCVLLVAVAGGAISGKVAGVDHVSLGPDFYDYLMDDLKADDMVMPTMVGLEDHSKLQAVPRELRRRGLSEDETDMVARGNFLRVMKKVVG